MRLRASVLATALLLALPSFAAASCRSKIGEDGHVVTQTRTAVVYWRNDDPSISRTYYGCELRTGKLRRVNRFLEQRPRLFRLAGRYLGFALSSEEGADSEFVETIQVIDLRTGHRRLQLDAVEPPTPQGDRLEAIRSYVLKPNASVAWIAEYRPDPNAVHTSFQVNRVETTRDDGFTTLDQGDGIRPRSLALSDDRATVYWRNAGAVRSAPLR